MQQFSSISNGYDNKKSSAVIFDNKRRDSFFKPIIQARLTIGPSDDIYEREADAMADRVVRMGDNDTGQEKFFKPAVSPVQRKCAHCAEEENKIQRKEMNGQEAGADTMLEDYVGKLNNDGQMLPQEVRSFYEPRIGYDFSQVKIHTDSVAAQSAQSINALAYTSGNNIVFNSGQYSPGTETGKRLLGHELTHVVQQQTAANAIQRYTETTEPTSIAGEVAADLGSVFFPLYGIGRGISAAKCLQNLEQPMIDITFQRWLPHVCGRTAGSLHSRNWDAFGHCWIACEGTRACGGTPTSVAGAGREFYREYQRARGQRPHDSFSQDLANQGTGRRLSYSGGTCYALCDRAQQTGMLNLTAPQSTCVDCANPASGEGPCPP